MRCEDCRRKADGVKFARCFGMSIPNSNPEQERENDEFQELLESSLTYTYTPPRRGEIRNAVILQIDEREIIVDLGAKQDGIVPSQVILNTLFDAIRQTKAVTERRKIESKRLELFDRLVNGNF